MYIRIVFTEKIGIIFQIAVFPDVQSEKAKIDDFFFKIKMSIFVITINFQQRLTSFAKTKLLRSKSD